jgi:hypothetical protein
MRGVSSSVSVPLQSTSAPSARTAASATTALPFIAAAPEASRNRRASSHHSHSAEENALGPSEGGVRRLSYVSFSPKVATVGQLVPRGLILDVQGG